MSPPLPLDHLIIKDHQHHAAGGLLLGRLALRSTTTSPTLDLSLMKSSFSPSTIANNQRQHQQQLLEPSLTLSLIFPNHDHKKLQYEDQSSGDDHGTMSSFSNTLLSSVKREREEEPEEVDKVELIATNNNEYQDVTNIISSSRKKLRLNKEQAALLEDSFKLQSTLNPKEALARKLNLRPRQVEVWFQNRRARTKLKQTEVDCELLKKCCKRLTEENRRLQKELQELKALNKQVSEPLYMQVPSAASLTVCSSCERLADVRRGTTNNSHPYFMSSKQCIFFSPFTKRSAAY